MINFDFISTKDRKIINFNELDIKGVTLLGKYNYTYGSPKTNIELFKDYIEILYLDKGFQYYFVNNKQYFLESGDLLIILPNEKHYPINFFENRGRLYWLIIDISNIDEFLSYKKEESNTILNLLIDNSKDNKKIKLNAKVHLENIFKIYSNMPDNQLHFFIQKAKIEFEIARLLINIIHKQVSIYDLENSYSHRINKCVKYIRNNIFEKNLTIKEVSKIASLSESYFIKTFKKEVGLPPKDYINKIKIDVAKKEIQTNSKSITYLAYELNFSSSQYFSRVFKKYVGKTPSEYKQQFEFDKRNN